MSYVNSVVKISRKVLHIIITSRISDHWKEKMVPVYAFILLKNSLFILGILFLNILIYLFSDIKRLQENIKKRNREFEQSISDEYLQNIQDRYLDFLKKQQNSILLIIKKT